MHVHRAWEQITFVKCLPGLGSAERSIVRGYESKAVDQGESQGLQKISENAAAAHVSNDKACRYVDAMGDVVDAVRHWH